MAQNPDLWDYAVAGVPSALTEDMEAAQLAKKVCSEAMELLMSIEKYPFSSSFCIPKDLLMRPTWK
jgi:hypothetical protein